MCLVRVMIFWISQRKSIVFLGVLMRVSLFQDIFIALTSVHGILMYHVLNVFHAVFYRSYICPWYSRACILCSTYFKQSPLLLHMSMILPCILCTPYIMQSSLLLHMSMVFSCILCSTYFMQSLLLLCLSIDSHVFVLNIHHAVFIGYTVDCLLSCSDAQQCICL